MRNSILEKIEKYMVKSIHDRIYPQKRFVWNKVDKRPVDDNMDWDKEVYLEERGNWYICKRSAVCYPELIDKWKIVINSRGKKRRLDVYLNGLVYGRSRTCLGIFDNGEEAWNYFHYMESDLVRYAFTLTDMNLKTIGTKVPDLMDYTQKSVVKFDETLDEQIFDMFHLTKEEREYVEHKVMEI